MLKNYFKIAIRNLKKHKTFSIINILGFAFGISICMMIVLYLIKEYSFDDFNVNAKCIYRLVDAEHNKSKIDYRVKKAVADNFPQVEHASIIEILPKSIETNYKNNAYYVDNLMSTDNDFFKIFTVHFIYGNPNKPFPNINSVIISEKTSHLLFGNENPMGKEISIFHRNLLFVKGVIKELPDNRNRLIVTGVIKDLPDNSSLKANIIVNAKNNNFKFGFYCGNSS
ncbi:MAG: ABC transporter permease, partial [Ignavibacteriaceae bacterium]